MKKNNREIRTLNAELRADKESRTIEGYAAVFEQETDLGWFREMIRRGAFEGSDMTDVRALFNHDPNMVLGRTKSGTLKLEVDERGLKYSFDAPNTSIGNDLLEMIRRGDVSQSSFAFSVEKAKWVEEDGQTNELREIEKIGRLYDVSPVTYPAYTQTTVQARSLEQIKAEEHPDTEEEDDNNEEFEKQQRTMNDRVRQMRFSIIQTNIHNDH